MSSNNPSGLILPTQLSYTPGAGNPRDSAMMSTQAMNAKQNTLSNAVGGKRKRRYKGGADSIIVPQYQMLYPVQNGPGTTPNDQIVGLSSTGMQSASWAADDSKASISGGSKRNYRNNKYKKGGNPDWLWGCYSGGRITRKTKKVNRKHSRKNKRKSRRNHK